jgi:hypothetical protein
LERISSEIQILLKEIAASALMIFLDRDSILPTILLMVGESWKITWPIDWQVREKAELYVLGQPKGG